MIPRLTLGIPVKYGAEKDDMVSNHRISEDDIPSRNTISVRYLTCLTEKGVWKAIGKSRRLEAENLYLKGEIKL